MLPQFRAAGGRSGQSSLYTSLVYAVSDLFVVVVVGKSYLV